MGRWQTRLGLAAVSAGFIGISLLFMKKLGIEADEAMVANAIYEHGQPWYSWRFGQFELPVMLLSYLGALKSWILNPYFALFPPGPVSLRVPAALAGAGTLWLFFAFLDGAVSRRAAWIGSLLLATDSSFLLIETTDFGFVALQFLFKLAGILLLLRFHQTGKPAALAGGFFLFGLALWDKAVFAWVLCGIAVASLVVFPRAIAKRLSVQNAVLSAAALMLGALPLVVYNIARPLETVRANAIIAREPIGVKGRILLSTIDGSALFGFLTAADPGPLPGVPRNAIQRLSLRVATWTRNPHRNLMLAAFAAAIVAALLRWRWRPQRAVLFALIGCAVTWLCMAFTAGAGGAVQHTILLWPFHLMIVAAVIAQLPKWWASAVTAVLCLSGLAVTNQYYADLVQNGPAIRWTDAFGPLEMYLKDSRAERIFIADWGVIETLSLMSEGSLSVYSADVREPAVLDSMLETPRGIFVSHTPVFTFDPSIRLRLEERASIRDYECKIIATIADQNHRPTFEIIEFVAKR